jgi:hypothetical protein
MKHNDLICLTIFRLSSGLFSLILSFKEPEGEKSVKSPANIPPFASGQAPYHSSVSLPNEKVCSPSRWESFVLNQNTPSGPGIESGIPGGEEVGGTPGFRDRYLIPLPDLDRPRGCLSGNGDQLQGRGAGQPDPGMEG